MMPLGKSQALRKLYIVFKRCDKVQKRTDNHKKKGTEYEIKSPGELNTVAAKLLT